MATKIDGADQSGEEKVLEIEVVGRREDFRTAPFRLVTGPVIERENALVGEGFYSVGSLTQEDLDGYRLAGWTVIQDAGRFYVKPCEESPQDKVEADQVVIYQQLERALKESGFHPISRGETAPKLVPHVRNAGGVPIILSELPAGMPSELWARRK